MAFAKAITAEVEKTITVTETVGVTLEMSSREAFDLKMLLGKTSGSNNSFHALFLALDKAGVDQGSLQSVEYKVVDMLRDQVEVNSIQVVKR